MNTLTFVFGQLLTLEMLAAGRQPVRQHIDTQLNNRLHNKGFGRRTRPTQQGKEFVMDNSILVILFLIVSLIANFAMPSSTEK